MRNVKDMPYFLGAFTKYTIDTTEQLIDLGDNVCLCHNAGDDTIYVGPETGVSSDNMELGAGDRILIAGKIYAIGADTGMILKVQVMDTTQV